MGTMDKALLVKRTDLEIQGLLMDALSRTEFPVSLCDWYDEPESRRAELVIASPWYDSKGQLASYTAIVNALLKAGVYEEVFPKGQVYLKSPHDPLVKAMEKETQEKSGSLHVLLRTGPQKRESYSVLFMPHVGRAAPIPARQFSGKKELEDFLLNRLHVRRSSVEEGFEEIEQQGNTVIPVRLTLRGWRTLGLARKQNHAAVKSVASG
ncbi:MAG: hypothetical protein ACLQOO_28500 [Terriglobia bacterium]